MKSVLRYLRRGFAGRLDDETIDRIARRVVEVQQSNLNAKAHRSTRGGGTVMSLEEKIDEVITLLKQPAPAPLSTDAKGASALLRCKSRSAFRREAIAIGLKPYVRGKYYIRDIENAVARAAIRARKSA